LIPEAKMIKGLMNILGLTMLAVIFLASCSGQAKGPGEKAMGFEQLKATLSGKEPFLLVDVRTAEEYASGHIPGAFNVPVTEITEKIPTQDKNAFIILYCRSGNRSGAAEQALREKGYTNMVNFGAVSKWQDPLVTGAKP